MSEPQETLTIQQALDLAVQHHTAGRLSQAENIYQQILQNAPNQADALHLLGVIAHQEGRNEVAVERITKAISIQPDFAEAHDNLGVSLQDLGKLEEAVTSHRKALDLNPEYVKAHYNLGVALQGLDRLEEAVVRYQKALALKPNYEDAHYNLGNALRGLGKAEEALTSYRKALDLKPDYTEVHNDLGVALHGLGRLEDAVASYHEALAINPDYAEAHYNLGAALHDLDRLEDAVDSYDKALVIKPDFAEAHNSLGAALHDLDRLEDAVASYSKALVIKRDYPHAHNNLGNALKDLGRMEKAIASYRKALALDPDFAHAHNNLGTALKGLGRMEKAIASYRKALVLDPDFAHAHNNLGTALQDVGQLEEARVSYRKALTIKPYLAEAHSNLGSVLNELDKFGEALTQHRRAISLDPQNDVFWASFAGSLERITFTSVDDNLFQDLFDLLERSTVRPSYITRSVISALRHHPAFSSMVEATVSSQQDSKIPYRDIAEQLSRIPLLLKLLKLSPVFDIEIEQALTVLRRAMIEATIAGKTDEMSLPFSTALALHCFVNEYVFPETEEEKEAVEKLETQIATLLENSQTVPPSFVVALGAYRPLFRFSWAKALSKGKWEEDIRSVIKRQITEPLEERSLRDQIPSITPIQNVISQLVRAQYEENPYPRWVKTGIVYKSRSLDSVLKGPPLLFDLGDYTPPESPEILIAGCGTGQHALTIASRFSNSHVLALDLSSHSLAYAERKTRELGFSNIEYVQGDILELGKLERQFDLIECIGVLHHLGDPLAGWQMLVDLLRPGGLMKIGLYSEIARQNLVAGFSLISEKGYSTSADDIRRCRQDIIEMAGNGNTQMKKIRDSNDFFSTSECRDLLFHVQEKRLTLPQIEEALTSLQLKFLGFEIQNRIVERKFKESHANNRALASLSLWHKFEVEHPDTFIGMYQFWCKRL